MKDMSEIELTSASYQKLKMIAQNLKLSEEQAFERILRDHLNAPSARQRDL